MQRWVKQAALIKQKRFEKRISQSQLSEKLGYKNGQFISNIERQRCGVPIGKAKLLCELLEIKPHVLQVDMATDYLNNLRGALHGD